MGCTRWVERKSRQLHLKIELAAAAGPQAKETLQTTLLTTLALYIVAVVLVSALFTIPHIQNLVKVAAETKCVSTGVGLLARL